MRSILAAFLLFPALAWAGYVNGPSSSVDGDAAVFIGTSGTFIRDGGGSPIVDVPTNAALQALSTATAQHVYRSGYYSDGDGGGGLYLASAAACSIAGGDGGSQVPSADSNCWLLQNNGQPYNVLQFGAQANYGAGNRDNLMEFAAALATKQDVFVPCGRYRLSGSIQVQWPGQHFFGGAAGQYTCGSDLVVDAISTDFLQIGSSSPGNWIEVDHFNITATNMSGTFGSHNANAINISGGPDIHIHDINVTNPWNGEILYENNVQHAERIVNTNTRGEYNEYVYGGGSGTVLGIVWRDIQNSGLSVFNATGSGLTSAPTTLTPLVMAVLDTAIHGAADLTSRRYRRDLENRGFRRREGGCCPSRTRARSGS